MKKLSSPFARLLAVASCALALGSCNRAEYAALPKGSTYYGEASQRRAVAAPDVDKQVVAADPVVAEAAPAPKPAVAIAPTVLKTAVPAAVIAGRATVNTTAAAPSVIKPTLLQRLALAKVTHQIDKKIQKATARQHANTASVAKTSAISGNLRIGIILLLVGLLVGLFNGLIGTIIAIVGLVFIVLWLLDQL